MAHNYESVRLIALQTLPTNETKIMELEQIIF